MPLATLSAYRIIFSCAPGLNSSIMQNTNFYARDAEQKIYRNNFSALTQPPISRFRGIERKLFLCMLQYRYHNLIPWACFHAVLQSRSFLGMKLDNAEDFFGAFENLDTFYWIVVCYQQLINFVFEVIISKAWLLETTDISSILIPLKAIKHCSSDCNSFSNKIIDFEVIILLIEWWQILKQVTWRNKQGQPLHSTKLLFLIIDSPITHFQSTVNSNLQKLLQRNIFNPQNGGETLVRVSTNQWLSAQINNKPGRSAAIAIKNSWPPDIILARRPSFPLFRCQNL